MVCNIWNMQLPCIVSCVTGVICYFGLIIATADENVCLTPSLVTLLYFLWGRLLPKSRSPKHNKKVKQKNTVLSCCPSLLDVVWFLYNSNIFARADQPSGAFKKRTRQTRQTRLSSIASVMAVFSDTILQSMTSILPWPCLPSPLMWKIPAHYKRGQAYEILVSLI